MRILKRNLINCERAEFLISKSVDTRLLFLERSGLKFHLTYCSLCRNYEKQMAELSHLIGRYRHHCENGDLSHSLSGESRKNITIALKREMDR